MGFRPRWWLCCARFHLSFESPYACEGVSRAFWPHVNLFDQNIIQLIYGDRISLIDPNTERVVIIENKALADFQKVIFRQLYDKLPLPSSSHFPTQGVGR